MSWHEQLRILELSGAALPKWRDDNLFTVLRVHGTEKIGRLYSYTVEVATLEDRNLHVSEATNRVDVDQLVGKEVTIRIALSGNGTWAAGQVGVSGSANIGADVREITGLIVSAECVGADDRRAYYRLQIRPWLHLATLNRDSRLFLNASVRDISEEILKKYPYPYEVRLNGPGFGRKHYPKRDYQRMFWESDYELLARLWQEFGISYYYQGNTLVLCDSSGGFRKHGPAYQTVRYLAPDGQRIDEEHIHQFEIARKLTTGRVRAIDYDYTQSLRKLAVKDTEYADRSFDNYEEYAWGDYTQPLEGPMGTAGEPNDVKFEGEFLARVRLEAHRCRSLRAKGKGNLRGLMAGHTFRLEGFPLKPGDENYLVISTKLDIRNNDTIAQPGGTGAGYSCETRFTVQPLAWGYRTPLKAKKPRSHSEVAVVTGYQDQTTCTDQYGRVKVQFKWDRERPADQNSSCWIRVSSPWQGDGYGAIYIPRVGQEVVIGYQDNDPDKPFIIGRHINRWQPSPWALPDNQALSGWRSRDASDRSVAANSVVTDDTPGRLQVQVSSDQAQSRLVLGSNTRIDGHKGRAQARGEGFELATGGHGVTRANGGLLLTTEPRSGAQAPMKDMGETVYRLTAARQLHEDLATQAQLHDAQQAGTDQSDVVRAIKVQNDSIRGGAKSSENPFPEMARPDLVLSSSAGIGLTAADSTHIASNEHLAISTGQSVGFAAGKSFLASVRERFSVFVQNMGISLVAAGGKIRVEAQSDGMKLIARQVLELISTTDWIELKAKQGIRLNGGGSEIEVGADGVRVCTAAQFLVHAATFDVDGPQSRPQAFDTRPHDQQFTLLDKLTGKPLSGMKYEIRKQSGEIVCGVTDASGKTQRVNTDGVEKLSLKIVHKKD